MALHSLLTGAIPPDNVSSSEGLLALQPCQGRPQAMVHPKAKRHMAVQIPRPELKEIAEKHHKMIPQLALRWVLQHPAVSVALVGSRSVQEVEDNMGALSWALSHTDREEIEAVFMKHDIDTSPDIWIDQP